MSGKQTAKTDYDGSTPLKSIMQEMFVDNLLKGMPQYEAYKQAGYKGKTEETLRTNSTHALTTNNNIKARLDYKRARIAEKTDITVGYLQRKYINLAESCLKKGKQGVARACYADLMKSIGGFKADEPSDKSIELKLIDAEARLEVARALQGYYDGKYLASSSR